MSESSRRPGDSRLWMCWVCPLWACQQRQGMVWSLMGILDHVVDPIVQSYHLGPGGWYIVIIGPSYIFSMLRHFLVQFQYQRGDNPIIQNKATSLVLGIVVTIHKALIYIRDGLWHWVCHTTGHMNPYEWLHEHPLISVRSTMAHNSSSSQKDATLCVSRDGSYRLYFHTFTGSNNGQH